jgi:hypothetical protein
VAETGAGHAFAEAAFFDEVLFQTTEQLIEEVVGLMDEAEGDVGEDFGRAIGEEWAIGFVGLVGF